jgi:peroxiredoxin
LRGHIARGDRLPAEARLAVLAGEGVQSYTAGQLFGSGRSVVIGVPGAFTPVCTRVHLPEFVAKAPALLASGFHRIACVAPNDPWTLSLWSRQLDPAARLKFFSDGNLEFGRMAGLTTVASKLFLGECLKRFVMIIADGAVEKVAVEAAITDVTCTAAALI